MGGDQSGYPTRGKYPGGGEEVWDAAHIDLLESAAREVGNKRAALYSARAEETRQGAREEASS